MVPANIAITVLHIVSYTFVSLVSLIAFICIFVGKLPAGAVAALSFIGAATVDAALIYDAVEATKGGAKFVFNDFLEYIIVAGIATLLFIISIIVLVALNKKKDLYEDDFGSQNLI